MISNNIKKLALTINPEKDVMIIEKLFG
jgi:hypothetical protein